jgi:hypothetical protein
MAVFEFDREQVLRGATESHGHSRGLPSLQANALTVRADFYSAIDSLAVRLLGLE